MKHHQARVCGKIAERFRLREGRNEEIPTTHLKQRLDRLAGAKAIAVGLHRGARSNASAPFEPTPVGLDRASIDAQAERVVHRRRRSRFVRAKTSPTLPCELR